MGEVIHVEFGKKKIEIHEVSDISNDIGLRAYLNSLLDSGVDKDDVLETHDAITDMDCYFASDDVIKEFANGWLHQFL